MLIRDLIPHLGCPLTLGIRDVPSKTLYEVRQVAYLIDLHSRWGAIKASVSTVYERYLLFPSDTEKCSASS